MNEGEATTRKTRIDPRLKAEGWRVVPLDRSQPLGTRSREAVEEFETDNGPADYALCDDGQLRGIVEAKKLTLGPQGVLTQAQRYAQGVRDSDAEYCDGCRVPFLYSTNGEVIWFQDVRHTLNRSRPVASFHTPAALEEMLGRDVEAELAGLDQVRWSDRIRPYQIECNQAIEQGIRERKRQMLVAMATGTGKTFTLVHEIYRLMKSGVARRVLFLVDRRALAAQAVQAFASFEAEPGLKFDKLYEVYSQRFKREDFEDDKGFDPKVLPTKYLTDPQPGHAFVYVSTIQRMSINLFGKDAVLDFGDGDADDDAEQLHIPIHAFDLVIADECHRGYTSKELSVWRNTLDHFDAVKVGLTATPAAHTMAYFKEVAYRYDYERAVQEGYLVDYDVVRINSDVRMNGVFLKEGEAVATIDTTSGQQQFDLLEDERQFATTEVERRITAPDSNRKILEEIKRYAEDHETEYGRFPKTLIFADNDLPHTSHADQLVDLAREIFGRGDAFVAKITGKVDRPLQRIKEFRNRPKPSVVLTVDLLTTGVDIPDLEFIVFLRPVKSRILFEQMLGRGTRKGERFPDKSHFVVFDCFDGTLLEYFRNTTDITSELPDPDPKTIKQVIEDIWQNRDRDYNVKRLVKRLQRIDKQMSGDARELFSRYIPDGDLSGFAETLPSALKASFGDVMKMLRDSDFQKLLVDYPRPPRHFIVAEGTQDVVESEWLIKGGVGKEYKPADYLELFFTFVREHAEDTRAIEILLSRPEEWSAQALTELREVLTHAPEHFTETNLQKAFARTHRKDLVDIISMVKRASMATSPLLTAEERVNAAVERVVGARALTADQAKWIDYIRQHLIANLSIERDDFDDVPVLSSRGGWGRANRAFDGQLPALIADLNKELAA